jgi:hypothetical protein
MNSWEVSLPRSDFDCFGWLAGRQPASFHEPEALNR